MGFLETLTVSLRASPSFRGFYKAAMLMFYRGLFRQGAVCFSKKILKKVLTNAELYVNI